MRDGTLLPNPDGDYYLMAGDMVAIMGNRRQLMAFQELVQPAGVVTP
jgi:K+/H+ antiporter YhaU regulatory subunit KhtT